MMTDTMNSTLIDYYKAIEGASQQMLQAALSQDWDEVVRLEGACAVLIEQLHQRSRSESLLESQRPEKARIMHRILRNDAEIRYLTEPWLSELDRKFMDEERRVH